ncbi:flagellar motor protein MotB [Pseudaestuariivita rosea]|uniref:flagellar motor protein MotB n=1 Tax=Pseudaestuariivita rosea TaxID=2763263 RepID=UPI001ABBE169|nr:flagellar motor protein MotB [Pseudaestuariivita rosea]
MSGQSKAPIIIKRKKVVAGGGHHGGAWKVAYADFVTAMMAFFMLMWLLNATTENQRKGLADYFSPSIAVTRTSGGGDGAFGGENIFSTEMSARTGVGATRPESEQDLLVIGADGQTNTDAETDGANEKLFKIEEELLGLGGESDVANELMKHITTRVTDEGLVVEIFATPDDPIFDATSGEPTRLTVALVDMIADVFQLVENNVAIEGHSRSKPIVVRDNPVWQISTDRAATIRTLFENSNFDPMRLNRTTGHADREPIVENTMSVRNDRIEIILLRD